MEAEENNDFKTMINLDIQLEFIQDKTLFDRRVVLYWEYKHDKDDMKKYKKEYKYFNTAENKIEKHIRSGLIFNKVKTQTTWVEAQFESVNFKLTKNDTELSIQCNP